MQVVTQTYRLDVDDRLDQSRIEFEGGSVWRDKRPGELQMPILNFALSEVVDLAEDFNEGGAVPYEDQVRLYFDIKRRNVVRFEDSKREVAGFEALVRELVSDHDGTEVFSLFVNIRLDEEFMQEFSADCLLADRAEFEPLFWEAILGVEFTGDRRAAIDAQEQARAESYARMDALIAKAEATAAGAGAGGTDGDRGGDPAEPERALEPFVPPASHTAEHFRIRGVELDLDRAGTGWEVTTFSHEVLVNLSAVLGASAGAAPEGLLSEYGDGKILFSLALSGVYGPGGVPTGRLTYENGKCKEPYLYFRSEGLDYGLEFSGVLELRDGWVSLRGQLGRSYEAERFEVDVQLRLDPSVLDWSEYQFTTTRELDTAPAECLRFVSLRLEAGDPLPACLAGATHLEAFTISSRSRGMPLAVSLPPELFGFPRLKQLSLIGVQLTRLPKDLADRVDLERLNLSNCGLATLPDGVWRLPKLQYLWLHGNQLETVPAAIDLPEIQSIDLGKNGLRTLPESLLAQPKLRSLKLTGNPWETLPDACNEGRVDIDLPIEDKRRLLDFEYRGADGQGLVAWDDEAFYTRTHPELDGKVRSALKDDGLEAHAEALRHLVKHAVGFRQVAGTGAMSVGSHRFGGMPDLPPSIAYPRYEASSTHEEQEGDAAPRSLAYEFIAQVNCSAIAHLQGYLPRTGMLYFFLTTLHDLYGGSKASPARVVYFDGAEDELVSGETIHLDESDYFEMTGSAYEGFAAEAFAFPCAPQFYAARQNPHLFSGAAKTLAEDEEFLDEEDEVFSRALNEEHPHDHSMGGYAFTQHEDPEHQASLVLKGNPEDWVILLTVSSRGDFMWGDAGDLFFVIHKSDLAKRDFSNVFCTMESS